MLPTVVSTFTSLTRLECTAGVSGEQLALPGWLPRLASLRRLEFYSDTLWSMPKELWFDLACLESLVSCRTLPRTAVPAVPVPCFRVPCSLRKVMCRCNDADCTSKCHGIACTPRGCAPTHRTLVFATWASPHGCCLSSPSLPLGTATQREST